MKKTIIEDITSIEEIGTFDDEYVYDLEMEDDSTHTFFANDILVHNSCGCTINEICIKNDVNVIDKNGDLTPEFIAIETAIGNHLNREINKWAIEKLNSKDPRFVFKRESVCPKALWTGKKHYIMYIVNKEGKKKNEFKYSGLQIAKSSFSKAMKDISKGIVQIILTQKSKAIADSMIFDIFESFENFSMNDIAERGGIKVLDKWEGLNDGLSTAKGTTRAAKYAIYHNELIKELDLENKYRKIENGGKLKLVFVKDNKYNIEGIAYQDMLPTEFHLKVDYERMFFKAIIRSLEPIYNALGWYIPDPKIQYETPVEDLFC